MLRWRVYYADGSAFGDCDGDPGEAPALGVLVVIQYDEAAGVERLYYKHFYCWSTQYQRWLGMGDQRAPGDGHFGLFHYLTSPGWKRVLCGETVPYVVFSGVLAKAIGDSDIGPKSAILPTEEDAPR